MGLHVADVYCRQALLRRTTLETTTWWEPYFCCWVAPALLMGSMAQTRHSGGTPQLCHCQSRDDEVPIAEVWVRPLGFL